MTSHRTSPRSVAVSKVSGEAEPDLREAIVSPELVQALANQEIDARDIGRGTIPKKYAILNS